VKNLIALMCTLALTPGVAAQSENSHGLSSPHPTHTLVPSAAVVHYTNGTGTGLSAVYSANINAAGSVGPGYILTGGKAGNVGWNIPSVAGGNFSVTGFDGAKFYLASSTNFSSTVPFKLVVQTTDGVNHVCQGTRGNYHFTAASHGNPAYSSYEAYANQFTPELGIGFSTVQKVAFVYTGNGTVGVTSAEVEGNNDILPGNYSYATTPDSKFNYQ
jgi:hypothetical protein